MLQPSVSTGLSWFKIRAKPAAGRFILAELVSTIPITVNNFTIELQTGKSIVNILQTAAPQLITGRPMEHN